MDKLNLDNEVHDLILGKSFEKRPSSAFHSIRYDFKPASVDTSQVSTIEVSDNSSVTVVVPHVEGSGTTHTVYKGNKRPCQKECVLIIDHKTGQFTLEKLASAMQLKKTRFDPKSRIRPISPADQQHMKTVKQEVVKSPVKKPQAIHQSQNAGQPQISQNPSMLPPQQSSTSHGIQQTTVPSSHEAPSGDASSDSSSSSSDSSDSEDDHSQAPPATVESISKESSRMASVYHSTLSEDLCLSESGSDSD